MCCWLQAVEEEEEQTVLTVFAWEEVAQVEFCKELFILRKERQQ